MSKAIRTFAKEGLERKLHALQRQVTLQVEAGRLEKAQEWGT